MLKGESLLSTPEIVPGARVYINQVFDDPKDLKNMGLFVGSEGIVRFVYETKYSGVEFKTKKLKKPFVYDVPTNCLSVF